MGKKSEDALLELIIGLIGFVLLVIVGILIISIVTILLILAIFGFLALKSWSYRTDWAKRNYNLTRLMWGERSWGDFISPGIVWCIIGVLVLIPVRGVISYFESFYGVENVLIEPYSNTVNPIVLIALTLTIFGPLPIRIRQTAGVTSSKPRINEVKVIRNRIDTTKKRILSFKNVDYHTACSILDSERFARSEQMDIEFECYVFEKAVPESQQGPAPNRKLKVSNIKGGNVRTLHVWGNENKRSNLDLVGDLEFRDKILIIGPYRPKDDARFYKDELGRDVFWISSWNGKLSSSGSRIHLLEYNSDRKSINSYNGISTFEPEYDNKQNTFSPPFYCQLCGTKHVAGTERLQCDTCGRFVCKHAFSEMATVGRSCCPMCDGNLLII